MDLLVQRKAFICLSQPANHIFGLGLTFLLHRLTPYPTCPNSITPSKWNIRRRVLVSMKVNLLLSQEWAGNKGTLWSLGWMCITEVRTELSERKRRRAEQRQEKLCPWWHWISIVQLDQILSEVNLPQYFEEVKNEFYCIIQWRFVSCNLKRADNPRNVLKQESD